MSNIKIPVTGTGDAAPTVATDTVAGIDFQKVKLVDGTAGSSTVVAATANGLKVDPSGVTSPVSGTFWQTTQPVSLVATTKVRWSAVPASQGTGLTTELNGLTNGSYSAVGSVVDNTANLDQYAACDIVLASLNPTAGAYLQLFLVQSLNGTNYEDGPSSTNPGYHMSVAVVAVTTGSGAKRIMTPWFRIPPIKFKLVLLNQTGVSLGATLNTVTVYTSDDQVN